MCRSLCPSRQVSFSVFWCRMFNLHQSTATALFAMIASVACGNLIAQESRPVDHRDGMQSGGGSPEAAAGDMVRALIRRDFQKFTGARPEGSRGGDTPNDFANHYVSLVTDTTFRSDDGVVTAHNLLRRGRLTLKRVSSPVAIDPSLISPYLAWSFGAHKRHSYVDVTVSDRDGTEFTTRMIVVYVEKQGLWKAYPIGLGVEPLYQKLDNLVIADDRQSDTQH